MRLASKLAINENSTLFVQSCPNFVQFTTSFMGTIGKVSWKLNKNCSFFINNQFWGLSHLLWISLYFLRCFAEDMMVSSKMPPEFLSLAHMEKLLGKVTVFTISSLRKIHTQRQFSAFYGITSHFRSMSWISAHAQFM